MKQWQQFPLLRILLPFITGIIFGLYRPLPPFILWIIICTAIAAFTFFLFNKKIFQNHSLRWTPGIFILASAFSFGAFLTYLHTDIHHDDHYTRHLDKGKQQFFIIRITEPPQTTGKRSKTIAEIKGVSGSETNTFKHCKGNILAYLPDSSQNLKYGNVFIFKGHLSEIRPPAHPYQFDYKKFLANRNIYHAIYLTPENHKTTSQNEYDPLYQLAFYLRQKVIDILDQKIADTTAKSISIALLTGQKDLLEEETRDNFSKSGIIHILAVSGLHVGLIYLVMSYLLSFLNKTPGGTSTKIILLIAVIWLYAMITGLAPSVMRAATMFSFILFGELINRKGHIINSILASALLLLIIDPFLIAQVGFQLSYAAVIAIVLLQKKIYQWLSFENYFLDKAWALSSVSIAAQLGTFPIVLLYFNQFPVYFLLSNLIAIPIATVVLYLGLLIIATNPLPLIPELTGLSLEYLIFFLNTAVKAINQLPASVIQGISISLLECIFIYLIITFTVISLLYRQKIALFTSFALIAVFCLLNVQEKWHNLHQRQIIVYNTWKNTSIDFIDGNTSILLTDSNLENRQKDFDYNIEPLHTHLNIEKAAIFDLPNLRTQALTANLKFSDDHIQFYNTRITLITPDTLTAHYPGKWHTDYLVLMNNPEIDVTWLLDRYQFKRLIITASNSRKNSEKWTRSCKALNIPYFHCAQKAFVEELQ